MLLEWIIAVPIILGTGFQDARTRTIGNYWWLIGLFLTLLPLSWEVLTNPIVALPRLWVGLLVSCVALALWYAGQFGGADAKAVILYGFLLSPNGYWNPATFHYVPILDALLPAIIINALWMRFTNQRCTPFLVPLGALLLATPWTGNLLGLPLRILPYVMT